MEYHEEFVKVDTVMEYHEELVDVVTLVELWESLHSWSAMRYSVDGTISTCSSVDNEIDG